MQSEGEHAARDLILSSCAHIKQLCAELYHYYSDLFREDEDVSRLWKKTALEEENHQKQFELAFRLRDECDFELACSLERVLFIQQKCGQLLEYVRHTPPDLVTALQKAIEMEEAISDIHMEQGVRSKDVHIHDMFQAMCKFDQGHVESLKVMLAVLKLPETEMAARSDL